MFAFPRCTNGVTAVSCRRWMSKESSEVLTTDPSIPDDSHSDDGGDPGDPKESESYSCISRSCLKSVELACENDCS